MISFGRWLLMALGLATLLCIAVPDASAHRRDPDKARLVASDSPDPFLPPGQSSKLSCLVYLRKVAGLGDDEEDDDSDCDDDRGGNRHHRKSFHVTIQWTIKSGSSTIRTIERTVELHPPFTYVKLPVGNGNKKKKFAKVLVDLIWNGERSNGQAAPAGTYNYVAVAEFTRTHEHRNRTVEKLIDESDPVNGTVTISSSGTVPTISLTSPAEGLLTSSATIVVSGSVSGTSPITVTLNGAAVPVANGAFSVNLPLAEGASTIQVAATNALGTATVVRQVTRDSTNPVISISSPPTGSTTASPMPPFVVGYTDLGSGVDTSTFSISLDSVAIQSSFAVGANQATFTPTTALAPGAHLLVASVMDRAGGLATAQSSFTIAAKPEAPSVNPFPSTTNVPLITLSGGKPTNTALLVDGVERVPLSAATSWVTSKTLVEGFNSIVLTTRSDFGLESAPVTVNVSLDTVPPPAPVSSIPPAVTTTNTVTLSGTKEPGTAVIINGVIVSPIDNSTTWTATVPLQEGSNNVVVECIDAVGNKSLAAGSQQTAIADEKPVIRDLIVTPSEITEGQSTQVTYRLFAAVPPQENADLSVRVRVEAGDLLIRELFSGVQQAGPDGPSYSASWNGTDFTGTPAIVNQSYRVVVSASRVAPTTLARDLVDANPKETAILLTGSQHFVSSDKKLEIIFRPDDAKMAIKAFPSISPRASKLLTTRSLHPQGCYRIAVDRPFSGAAVGVLTCADANGGMLRPFYWDETQQDWAAVGRSNWNPSSKKLSFTLPGAGLLVFATTDDVDQPYLADVRLTGSKLTLRVRDDTSGVDTRRLRLRRQGRDIRLAHHLQNGIHDVAIAAEGITSLENLTLYVEDWAGHGRLFPLKEGVAP